MENIQIGKVIRVRDTFLTENELDLKGKKGIVRLLYDADPTDPETIDEVQVDWTPETLDSFTDDYFYDAFDQEISWCSYILPVRVIEQTDEKMDENELAWKKQEIFVRLYLDGLGREGKLIVRAFEKPVDPEKVTPMDCWMDYLNEVLRFPVKCKVCFPYDETDNGTLLENQKVQLTGLNGVDRALGVMAEVTDGTRSYILPLQDLAGDGYSKDGRYIDAYGLWLVCNS